MNSKIYDLHFVHRSEEAGILGAPKVGIKYLALKVFWVHCKVLVVQPPKRLGDGLVVEELHETGGQLEGLQVFVSSAGDAAIGGCQQLLHEFFLTRHGGDSVWG